MTKLVFDYTECSEPECWDFDIPFEYCSKEQFILDVIDNPLLLNDMHIKSLYPHEIDQRYNKDLPDFVENIDQYVFTLEEWFDKNSVTKK